MKTNKAASLGTLNVECLEDRYLAANLGGVVLPINKRRQHDEVDASAIANALCR